MKKFILSLMVCSAALVGVQKNACAFQKGAEQECSKCHTLNTNEASDLLKELAPNLKVLEVNQGPIKGLWEIALETQGKKGIAYLDYSKKKVIVGGNILNLATKANYTRETYDRINKVDVSQIPLENSIVMGAKDAKHKIVVFDDPE